MSKSATRTPKTPPNSQPSAMERLLAGPPPCASGHWSFYLITDQPRHIGRKRTVEVNGITLRWLGCPDWSECHDQYQVFLPRILAQQAQPNPLAIVPELALRLSASYHELSIRCERLTSQTCPNGLCYGCWLTGRRVAGRPYFEVCEGAAGPYTQTRDLCEAHHAAFVERFPTKFLTEAP